ncbi:2-phosphosulfolactate phosphatase [Thermus filiformis]|uniref:Probable 2-phosphosulfolactate phosphatase n=1 Tax=Thermus filiformis TaxID=276 RepID=A0A0D6XAG9_THEFI|nr:2-phosphosulfolactate phosphatase [Thermus filiformis]KIX84667.1 2-phosphosulfolactate phosphatase [Thermus filiformis]
MGARAEDRVFRVHPLPQGVYEGVAVVIDVIRATTTAAAFLEAGVPALVLAADLGQAQALRRPGEVLAGERGGLRPEGFDLGNSPREAGLARGRTVVMATTNGTRAVHAARTARVLLLGSLNSARKTAEMAALWGEGVDLVCAGKEGAPGLDDLYTAGVIGQRLLAWGFRPQGEMAHLALFLAQNPPLAVLRSSAAGQALEGVGLGEDVEVCARVDVHETVPVRTGYRDGGVVFGRGRC